MEDLAFTTGLDTHTGVSPEPARRLELLSGMADRRRSWTLEQKLAIVTASERCDNMAALARRHDIRTSQLYMWRRELRYAVEAARSAEPMFVPVVAQSTSAAPPESEAVIEIEVEGAVIRVSRAASVELVAALVQALRVSR